MSVTNNSSNSSNGPFKPIWMFVTNWHFFPQSMLLSEKAMKCKKTQSIVVLHLEDQNDWFLCLLHAFGVELRDLAEGWKKIHRKWGEKPEDCWAHPPKASCNWISENWNAPSKARDHVPVAG